MLGEVILTQTSHFCSHKAQTDIANDKEVKVEGESEEESKYKEVIHDETSQYLSKASAEKGYDTEKYFYITPMQLKTTYVEQI